jgi:hypothetical protein
MPTNEEYSAMSDSDKKKEDWMNAKWRPMMGWMYMVVCMFDFVMFPILWSIVQTIGHGQVNVQWQPITLQGAGLFHIAMGAIIGVAAYGRTQEKLNGANNGGAQLGTTYTAPAPVQGSGFGGGMSSNQTGGFGNQSFGSSAPAPVQSSFSSPASQASSGFGGGFGSSTPSVNASGKKVVPTFGQPEL